MFQFYFFHSLHVLAVFVVIEFGINADILSMWFV